ncbi:uncharacterized protein TNCV_3782731 [Trichonephila clavipes]|nr:uncharacterized protein TNCV_3782731 [Trichonephila clavipes]
MAFSGSLPQINLGVQSETEGGLLRGAQRVNLEFRFGSNFRINPEQYFSGVENVAEFLENIDNNLTYYEIPTQLASAYLKGHLTEKALDWFEVLGYRVDEDKATDCAHLKQALSEQFPVVRNRSELETRFFPSSQKHNQKPADFVIVGGKREVTIDTRTIADHEESSIDLRVKVLRKIGDYSRRRGGHWDDRFHNQGG